MEDTAPPYQHADRNAVDRLRLWLQMLKAVRHVEGVLRERLRSGYDTTLPRFDVLAALHARPVGMKMSELSQHLIVSNGNVTGVVDRLVADGLAERHSLASDRRAIVVQITDKGRALMDDMAAAHLTWINEMFGAISEADAARGMSIMLDIRQGQPDPAEAQVPGTD
ncbi:MarR family winged helix-turn-helix transcriptional regulator [Pseudooceanicola sp. C21-150M6]|uniref:MarR family winged helix-turn-helix transcriptional regulator n=1 Tax=Pseudooceanicola sp. C21-150M6 TaxID=3434355 RepID=UPI003D7FDE98